MMTSQPTDKAFIHLRKAQGQHRTLGRSYCRLLLPLLVAAVVGCGLIFGWTITTALVLACATPWLFRLTCHAVLPRQPAYSHVKTSHNAGQSEQITRPPRFPISTTLFYAGMASVGGVEVRPFHLLNLSDILFVFASISLIAAILTSKSRSRTYLPPSLFVGLGLFAVGGLLSGAGHPLSSTFGVLIRMTFLTVIWFGSGTILLRSRRQLLNATRCWLFSSAASGAVALFQFISGRGHVALGYTGARLVGLSGQPNDLGGSLAVAVIPAVLCCTQSTHLSRRIRIWDFFVLATISAGLLLSGSTAALGALAIGLMFWHASGLSPRLSPRRALIAVVIVAIGSFFVLSTTHVKVATTFARLGQASNIQGSPGATLTIRLSTYSAALHQIADDPIIGTGLTTASKNVVDGYDVHNMLLKSWYDAGVVAFIGVLVLLVSVLKTVPWLLRRVTAIADRQQAAAFGSAFLVFIVFALFNPILYKRYGWVIAVLLFAFTAQVKRDSKDTNRTPHQRGDAPLGRFTPQIRPATAFDFPIHATIALTADAPMPLPTFVKRTDPGKEATGHSTSVTVAAERRHTIGALAVGYIGQGALAMTGVLTARMLGVDGRGYYALVILLPTIVALLGGLGLPQAVAFTLARDPLCFRGILRKWPAALLHIGVLMAINIVILGAYTLQRGSNLIFTGLASSLFVPAVLFQQYAIGLLQGMGRFRSLNKVRVVPAALYLVATVGLFVLGSHSLLLVTVGFVTGNFVGGVVLLLVATRGWRAAPEGRNAPRNRSLLRYGMRAVLGSVSPIDTFNLDQVAVGLFVSPYALGLYSTAAAFTNLPSIAANSISTIAFPRVASSRTSRDATRTLGRFLIITICASLILTVPVEIFIRPLLRILFGAAFVPATTATRIMLIGAFFWATRRTLTDGANGVGKPHLGSVAEIVSLVLLAISMAILVPLFGLTGAAISLTVACAGGVITFLPLIRIARHDFKTYASD